MHPNDPLYSLQWHLTRLGNIEKIWDEYSGAGIHVAVYDTGIKSVHPDLAGNYDAGRHVIIDGNPVGGEPNAASTNPTPIGHGTGVAGVLAAAANNNEGIVGVAWGATLTSVNIFNSENPIYMEALDGNDFLSAMHQMADFDVVNHSWGSGAPYDRLAGLHDPQSRVRLEQLQYEFASENGRHGLGTVLVQAVGNNSHDAQGFGLTTSRYTISVAATGEDGFVADFSNYGACILVAAPGDDILTTDLPGFGHIDGKYSHGVGTSFGTPVVSGVVALMLQANQNLGWRDVQNILAASATHTGSAIGAVVPGANEHGNWFLNKATDWNGGGMHFSNDYGYGVVNAHDAVRMAEVWSLFAPAGTSGNERTWFNSDDTDRAIPDGGSLQTSVLLTPVPAMTVEHVELTLELTHTDFTQLRIFLVSPAGTESQLYDGSAGTNAAADSQLKWTYATDALRGESAAGNWTVRIEDSAAGGTGTLSWFEIGVYGSTDSSNDTYHYTNEFLAMAALAGQGGRTTLTDAGGTDWIDAAAVSGNFVLNLSANIFSTVNGANWFKIAAGTTIEKAVTGDGNDTLNGNAAANVLCGMRGNDLLNGGAGGDALRGGAGNDSYVVDSGLDIVDENGADGDDVVQSSISFSLANAARVLGPVENLALLNVATALAATGNALANIISGNSFVNILTGGAGGDVLNGGGGGDTMRGGLDNDLFVVDSALDTVDEATLGGGVADTVQSSVGFSLVNSGRVLGIVEHLTLTGGLAISGTGNASANSITGNGAPNTIIGNAGNDTLRGMAGNDRLTGGDGLDTLAGGANNDIFVFNAPLVAANRDTITDFSNAAANNDTFHLENAVMTRLGAGVHALNPAFFWNGAAAHDANDYIVYNRATGGLFYDANGNGAGGVFALAVLTSKPVLTASDFVVI